VKAVVLRASEALLVSERCKREAGILRLAAGGWRLANFDPMTNIDAGDR